MKKLCLFLCAVSVSLSANAKVRIVPDETSVIAKFHLSWQQVGDILDHADLGMAYVIRDGRPLSKYELGIVLLETEISFLVPKRLELISDHKKDQVFANLRTFHNLDRVYEDIQLSGHDFTSDQVKLIKIVLDGLALHHVAEKAEVTQSINILAERAMMRALVRLNDELEPHASRLLATSAYFAMEESAPELIEAFNAAINRITDQTNSFAVIKAARDARPARIEKGIVRSACDWLLSKF